MITGLANFVLQGALIRPVVSGLLEKMRKMLRVVQFHWNWASEEHTRLAGFNPLFGIRNKIRKIGSRWFKSGSATVADVTLT